MKEYWRMRNGELIDIDKMSVTHLRNALKMIVRNRRVSHVKVEINGEIAQEFADKAMLYDISPELVCECDEFHVCQICNNS